MLALALCAALAGAPGVARAADGCWLELVNDYWSDGRVDRTYPTSCYREALAKLPPDVQQYSDAEDDLRRALANVIRDRHEGGGTDAGGGPQVQPAPVDEEAPKGFFAEAIAKAGPKNADSIPVQVLVLAGIALVLLGSAAASRLHGHLQAKRPQGAPVPRHGERIS